MTDIDADTPVVGIVIVDWFRYDYLDPHYFHHPLQTSQCSSPPSYG